MSKTSERDGLSSRVLDAEGILDRIAADALDQDYQVVAERRGLGTDSEPHERVADQLGRHGAGLRSSTLTVVALLLVGLLLTVAVIESQRAKPVQASNRQGLLDQIAARKAQLAADKKSLANLQATVDKLTEDYLAATSAGRAADRKLTRLSAFAGTSPVTGPGIRVTVDDAPDGTTAGGRVLDGDLQTLVNGLWEAGAEAVAINNQRITSFTPIRYAGNAITVNFRSMSRPYVVSAIGDRNTLAATFIETAGGSTWLDLQVLYGLRFEVATVSSMTLPGLTTVQLRFASRLGGTS